MAKSTIFYCIAVCLLVIGVPLFIGLFVTYEQRLHDNANWSTASCIITNTTSTASACYIKSQCDCSNSCDAPATCSGRIQQQTNGLCCDGDCCRYTNPNTNACQSSGTSECLLTWGTCYTVSSEFTVVNAGFAFTDVDGDCQMGDLDCVKQLLSQYYIGMYESCWISNTEKKVATSHNPYKDTKGFLAGSIIGLIIISFGLLYACLGYKYRNSYENNWEGRATLLSR